MTQRAPDSSDYVPATSPWSRHFHQRALRQAWRPFADKSLSHWTTTIVMALALTIHGVFVLLMVNANAAMQNWENDNQITVFMQRNADREQILQVGKSIKGQPGVIGLIIVSPKEASGRLKEMMGEEAALLDELDENPLPYSLEFRLARPDRVRASTLAKEISAMPGVESVAYDQQWAQRLSSIIGATRHLGNIISFLLLLAVALIVSNTIKLTIVARREEVEIMRLLGADDAFIQTPFLYEGMLQGVLGAGLSLVLTTLLFFGAQDSFVKLGDSFGLPLQLHFLPVSQLILMVTLGGILGLSGAWLPVYRFLKG